MAKGSSTNVRISQLNCLRHRIAVMSNDSWLGTWLRLGRVLHFSSSLSAFEFPLEITRVVLGAQPQGLC